MTARVVITGASGGIGRAVTERLRANGAVVVGLDIAGQADGVLACDVRDQAAVDRAMTVALEWLGGLDVLVNNAGVGTPQGAGERPDADALAVLDVNLLGAWRVTAAALPALRLSRGRVVNVASGLAFLTIPFAPAYCASKRGLVAYSDALRLEHGDAISVTTVYPGYLRTPIHRASEACGVSMDGLAPAERIEDTARTLVRAALGPPRRDLATTRRGAAAYAMLRVLPPAVVDRAVMAAVRRAVRCGCFAADGIAAEFMTRMVA